jgi:hypothetical protein
VRVKPLVSPALEYRLTGLFELVGGLAFIPVAVVLKGAFGVVDALVVAAPIFAGGMYWFAYRRPLARAIERAIPAPTVEREPLGRTRRRAVVVDLGLFAALVAFALLVDSADLVCGLMVGNGVAMLLTSRWLEQVESERGVTLLREPGWRLGPRKQRRNRGHPAQGFFVAGRTSA